MLSNTAKKGWLVTIPEQYALIVCVYWAEQHQQLNAEPAWHQQTLCKPSDTYVKMRDVCCAAQLLVISRCKW